MFSYVVLRPSVSACNVNSHEKVQTVVKIVFVLEGFLVVLPAWRHLLTAGNNAWIRRQKDRDGGALWQLAGLLKSSLPDLPLIWWRNGMSAHLRNRQTLFRQLSARPVHVLQFYLEKFRSVIFRNLRVIHVKDALCVATPHCCWLLEDFAAVCPSLWGGGLYSGISTMLSSDVVIM